MAEGVCACGGGGGGKQCGVAYGACAILGILVDYTAEAVRQQPRCVQ
jgi:hypothetical protein